jgi:hyperosmotically inducible protein
MPFERSVTLVFAATFAVALASAEDGMPPVAGRGSEAPVTPPSTEVRIERDEQISTAVGYALADDRRVHAMQMKVAVRRGVVTLTGSATDADEKRAAEAVVRGVAGVRDVENQLVVVERGTPEPGTSAIPEVPSPPAVR